jgi:hypothetical protein
LGLNVFPAQLAEVHIHLSCPPLCRQQDSSSLCRQDGYGLSVQQSLCFTPWRSCSWTSHTPNPSNSLPVSRHLSGWRWKFSLKTRFIFHYLHFHLPLCLYPYP